MTPAKPAPRAIPTRRLQVLAQDPSVTVRGKPLLTEVDVPDEDLAPGPSGYRVTVVDYDATHDVLYRPATIPVASRPPADLLRDPAFHAQHTYAHVMRTLARFEFALGRRVAWSFDGHQLHVAPHAFQDLNAFYAKRDRALYFGYVTRENGARVFTCLSPDVVAHETTHALLDGLRERYLFPSSPDQGAFHEGFADAVALLSVFSLPRVVERLLDRPGSGIKDEHVRLSSLTPEKLRDTAIFGLGEGLDPRGGALRRSVALDPDKRVLDRPEYQEPHNRGEVLVAALMQTFLAIWLKRVKGLSAEKNPLLYRAKVAEEGEEAAGHLLTMAIRAIDYAPATDLLFGDYLSALLTADAEVQPDDSRYGYRDALRASFAAYGISPASRRAAASEPGTWEGPDTAVSYAGLHADALRRDPDEMFRFLWQNRRALGIYPDIYTRVHSLRPCVRQSSDGFTLHETVAEYHQILDLGAGELARYGLAPPKGMPAGTRVTLYGGGALVFDEYGQLKFHVRNRILGHTRQNRRLRYLWESGYYERAGDERRFAALHRARLLGGPMTPAGKEVAHGDLF